MTERLSEPLALRRTQMQCRCSLCLFLAGLADSAAFEVARWVDGSARRLRVCASDSDLARCWRSAREAIASRERRWALGFATKAEPCLCALAPARPTRSALLAEPKPEARLSRTRPSSCSLLAQMARVSLVGSRRVSLRASRRAERHPSAIANHRTSVLARRAALLRSSMSICRP